MHYVVSVPINENIASFIGKKGSEESLIFFNRKVDDDVIVVLYPSQDEVKRHYAIAESMLLSAQIVISTESVDKLFGEVIVAASLLKKHVIILNENDVSKILANGIIKDYEVTTKEELLNRIMAHKPSEPTGRVRVDVDHAFPVKGIGTVILGIVTSGTVKVHDNLFSTSGKQLSIKSIQAQDVDMQDAGVGTRVGLAVKGIEPEDVDKGDLLLSEKATRSKSAKTKINVSAMAGEKVVAQSRYLFVSNFTHVIAKVDSIESGKAMLSFEKPVSVIKGDTFFLIREQSPRIFACGEVEEALA